MAELASGLIYYVVFLLSTTIHEAAHAWAALRGGDPTAYHGGQVSLSPVPHVSREPFGMVILPLISVVLSGWPFGFASAPYDTRWAMAHPRRAAYMALAGPASNLVLVVLAALALKAGSLAGVFSAPSSVNFDGVVAGDGVWHTVGFFLSVFFSLNLLLCIFNLIPVPPLDGSGAIPLFLNPDQTKRYQTFIWSNPSLTWIGIFVAWQVFDSLFQPVWLFAVNLLHTGVSYG